MPDIDDQFLVELNERLQDITLRANRLQEWVDLETYVNKLVSSFTKLHDQVRRAAGPMRPIPPVNAANFNVDRLEMFLTLWQSCDDVDLADLSEREKTLSFLRQPLALGAGVAADPQFAAWIADLLQKGAQIKNEITTQNATGIADICDEFDKALKLRVSAHRHRVLDEIKALALKSSQLYDWIIANTPPQPGNH